MADSSGVPRARPDVRAAGAVVWRRRQEVLLVHRPRYDDWSFPKGKLDRGEHVTAAAVREVAEETGVHVRLTAPLDQQRYPVAGGRTKSVDYWVGRVVGSDDVSAFQANAEVDAVRWVPADDALTTLTYDYDRNTLREARSRRKKTQALVVLRHGAARARQTWKKDDRERPLLRGGTIQAQRLVPVLAAYDVTTIASSSSRRCRETVEPYAATTGFELDGYDELSEEGADKQSVLDTITPLLESGESVVLCTHRPVLPLVWETLGVEKHKLAPAAMIVVHHRRGRVLAVESHEV